MTVKHSKIYTRRGDDGSTGLANGQRVEKSSARMQAIGDVDELNSLVGILAAAEIPEHIGETLLDIQHHLFDIGGGLAMPGNCLLIEDAVQALEAIIDELDAALPTLTKFILPGGTMQAAYCHNARAVCRRAERSMIMMRQIEKDDSDQTAQHYLNRLSDFLFVLARTLSRLDGGEEIFWRK